jgi:hypothetical protein
VASALADLPAPRIAAGVALWPLLAIAWRSRPACCGQCPGWWLAILGVVVLARAVFEIYQRPVRS